MARSTGDDASAEMVAHASAPTWRTGVAVGKFNPPHLGHAHLLRTGASQVGHLHVLLGDRPDQTLGAHDRAAWLADALPANVTIHVTPDDLPEADEPWARRALDVLPDPPDVAFTSEGWGPGWAKAMGSDHVMVDRDRATVPISGTALRADLPAHFALLVPAARAALCRRIVVVGAESTGKTTLAEALAQRVGTVWVPEHGRWYWEGRRHLADQTWTVDEFTRIARAQSRLEDDLARRAEAGLLVADTDALATAIWATRYLGAADRGQATPVQDLARARRPAHYLVCGPDIPWVQDGTRESRDQREDMHRATLAAVRASGVPHTILTGDHLHRLDAAMAIADGLRRSQEVLI